MSADLDLEHPDFPPRLAAPPLVFLALAVGAAAWLLGNPAGVGPWGPAAALGAAVELGAVSLGEFGFFSAGFIFWLVVALHSSRLATLGAWGGVGLRTLLRGHASGPGRLLEAASELIPLTAGLAVARAAGPWAGAAAFGLIWWIVPGFFRACLPHRLIYSWGQVRDGLGPAALGVAGAALIPALSDAPFYLLLPVAVGLTAMARPAREAAAAHLERGRQQQAELSVTQAQRSLVRTEEVQRKSGQEMGLRLETFGLIDRLLRSLPSEPGVKSVANGLLEQIRIKVPCQSAVLFLEEDRQLVPVAYITPHVQRLQMMELSRVGEPLVEKAWRSGRAEVLVEQPTERIFLGETCAVAVPLRERGVFYVGDARQRQYSTDQIDFLVALADHAGLALDAARYTQSQKEQLARESGLRSRLEGLLGRLSLVLEGVGELVAQPDPRALLDSARTTVSRLVNAPQVWLRLEGLDAGEPVGAAVAEAVLASGRPLIVEEATVGSRLNIPGIESILAVPVLSRQRTAGVIVALSPARAAFRREDMEILSVLAFQLGGSFGTAVLYAELQQAHRKLKESQAQLVQSSKLAAVGQLAGGVAHELNTPLAAIAVAVDGALLNLEKKPERVQPRLEKVRVSIAKMKDIVAKLLFYSRDARSFRRETDLNLVVADTLEMIGNQLRLDNIVVQTSLHDVPALLANQNELQQVLTNLLLNARDAVLEPGAREKRIHIATAAEGETVTLAVTDWGVGIPQEVQERIFEPFYTTKPVGSGTGLGLSVSTQLVSQHGGTLECRSEPGQGTRFTVRLPREIPHEEE